ncbi:MAG: hypothetical protein PHF86_00790 [Candidatus Nanoarchaeia archaeon]|nr:hypothetical protein [Candidatus Nanoarchaeia archaeon]
MKAKFINEIQKFERSGEPLDKLNIGNKEKREKDKILKISEANEILSNYSLGLYCLYIWESDSDIMKYYQDPKKVLEEYINLAYETLKEKEVYSVRKHLIVYKIDPNQEGIFIDEKNFQGFDGIKILFGLDFEDDKIYYV